MQIVKSEGKMKKLFLFCSLCFILTFSSMYHYCSGRKVILHWFWIISGKKVNVKIGVLVISPEKSKIKLNFMILSSKIF